MKNRSGVEKTYEVPTTKQILVQENDYVRAGTRLSDGGISPTDILNILGPVKAQEYIVNEIQAVYRLQGVKINDKHFEIIVRQMMRIRATASVSRRATSSVRVTCAARTPRSSARA